MPLGVQLRNENKYEEMIDIMLHLHKYVPSKTIDQTLTVGESEHTVRDEHLYPLLFGGDQLSVARYRGSKSIRRCSTTPTKRLEGMFPVVEDWHTEVVVLKVICHIAY